MPLNKRTYVDFDATIPVTASNMNDIQDNIISSSSYVACDTSASTAAKTVSLPGFVLASGSTIKVRFTNKNTASNPTLNVNNTGARAIYRNDGSAVGNSEKFSWSDGTIVMLTYDSVHWVIVSGGADSNGLQGDVISHDSYVTCTTYSGTAEKTVSLPGFVLAVGATIKVKFSYYNNTDSPTLNVNSTGAKPITTYKGTTLTAGQYTSWAAGEIIDFLYDGTNWTIFNKASTSSTWPPTIIEGSVSSVEVPANSTTTVYTSPKLEGGTWLVVSHLQYSNSFSTGTQYSHSVGGQTIYVPVSCLQSVNVKVHQTSTSYPYIYVVVGATSKNYATVTFRAIKLR